jgi:uncharacterized protein (DUF58 family)
MSSQSIKDYLDPHTLNQISGHQLLAKVVIESFTAGMHRSGLQGFGSEFLQYRNYSDGDDLKYVDWKVYGKQDKLYTKVYHEDANFNCHLIVDCSASMGYVNRHSQLSKLRYGTMLAAALGYLASQQGDGVGLYAYHNQCCSLLKPRRGQNHLRRFFAELDRLTAEGRGDHHRYLPRFAEMIRKRGLVIFISDFLDEAPLVPELINKLTFSHHDCIAIHLVDPDELLLPFRGTTRFYDSEDGSQIITSSNSIRKEYSGRFFGFLDGVKASCLHNNIDYLRVSTDEDLGKVLAHYLNNRGNV